MTKKEYNFVLTKPVMSFSLLPEDACFHLLMKVHPTDLYHVSAYIPELRKIVRRGVFQRNYQAKWVNVIYNQSLDPILYPEALLGLAIFRRRSMFDAKRYMGNVVDHVKIVSQALDHGDVETARWLIVNYSTKMVVTDSLLSHVRLTSSLRHLLFELGLANPLLWLCQADIRSQRDLVEEHLYRYNLDYTTFFFDLVIGDCHDDFEVYLTPEIHLNVKRLLLFLVSRGDLRFLRSFLTRIPLCYLEVQEASDNTENEDVLRLLLDHQVPLIIPVWEPSHYHGWNIHGFYVDNQFGFLVKKHGDGMVTCGQILNELSQPVPLNQDQRKVALGLGYQL